MYSQLVVVSFVIVWKVSPFSLMLWLNKIVTNKRIDWDYCNIFQNSLMPSSYATGKVSFSVNFRQKSSPPSTGSHILKSGGRDLIFQSHGFEAFCWDMQGGAEALHMKGWGLQDDQRAHSSVERKGEKKQMQDEAFTLKIIIQCFFAIPM